MATCMLLMLVPSETMAQEKSKWKKMDASPMDMSYYPSNAAWRNYLSGDDRNMSPKIRVVYSRPQVKGRTVFGDLVPYGQEWRLGANEATQVTFYQTVDISGTNINRGTYSMFVTPTANNWTITLSSQASLWGSENRDKSQDVAAFTVPVETLKDSREALSIVFQRVDDESANMVIEWDKTRASIPISFNPVLYEDIAVSPMDQVHYPSTSAYHNYLKDGEKEGADPKIKVTYCRPQKKGRDIFGGLLEYGNIWRVGANQSTEVTFYQDVMIGDKAISRGTYNLYAVVNENNWEIILNTDRPAWGPANRDEEKDIMKMSVPVSKEKEVLEALNIIFENETDNSVDMTIGWDTTRASIPIKFN